tara:strand:- start:1725 stop:2039 length:315 start_codon:yes stop_codon:yes gene_type:complete
MQTTTQSKQLSKLQRLCETVNRRYSSGLNDDDQVGAMFRYEEKIKDEARVIIGYDKYKALSVSQLKELKKDAETQTHKNGTKFFEFNITNNGMYLGRYKCNLPL